MELEEAVPPPRLGRDKEWLEMSGIWRAFTEAGSDF